MFLAAYSSTLFFLACFNAMVAGTLTAIVTFVSGGPTALVAILGVGALVAYAGTHTLVSRRLFRGDRLAPRHHGPAGPGQP
jgi:hypothetical protein